MNMLQQNIRCLAIIAVVSVGAQSANATSLNESHQAMPGGWQYAGGLEQPTAVEANDHRNLLAEPYSEQNSSTSVKVVRGAAPVKRVTVTSVCNCEKNQSTIIILRDAYPYEPDAGNWRNAFSRRHSWQDWTKERVDTRKKLYNNGLY